VKLHLLFINLLFISFATTQIYSMQPRLGSQASDNIVRLVAFGASAPVAVVGLGIGSLGTFLAFGEVVAHYRDGDQLAHFFGTVIGVPAILVGSLATLSALLAVGVKDKPAMQVSAAIFGVSMLLNSLSHWTTLKRSYDHELSNFCIGAGVVTGIAGLAALGLCLRK